jgi:hypothetical protein
VFGTLHTSSAAKTIDRIIDAFPGEQQGQIRAMLSESLEAVIAQTLVKKKGGGRIAACEVLIGVPAVRNLIREGKLHQIPSMMQTGQRMGMQTLDMALADLLKRGLIEPSALPAKPAMPGTAPAAGGITNGLTARSGGRFPRLRACFKSATPWTARARDVPPRRRQRRAGGSGCAAGHALRPVVLVGQAGVTDAVVRRSMRLRRGS